MVRRPEDARSVRAEADPEGRRVLVDLELEVVGPRRGDPWHMESSSDRDSAEPPPIQVKEPDECARLEGLHALVWPGPGCPIPG